MKSKKVTVTREYINKLKIERDHYAKQLEEVLSKVDPPLLPLMRCLIWVFTKYLTCCGSQLLRDCWVDYDTI